MKKSVLLVLCSALVLPLFFQQGCLLSPDTQFIYKDTLVVHDTISIRPHDTVKINNYIHDTTIMYDTIKTFAINTLSGDLRGVWKGQVGNLSIILTVSAPTSYSTDSGEFTANIGTTLFSGRITSVTGNIASVVINSGYSVINQPANWIFSIQNNVLTLQQSGYQMFPTMQAFTLSRIQ